MCRAGGAEGEPAFPLERTLQVTGQLLILKEMDDIVQRELTVWKAKRNRHRGGK